MNVDDTWGVAAGDWPFAFVSLSKPDDATQVEDDPMSNHRIGRRVGWVNMNKRHKTDQTKKNES